MKIGQIDNKYYRQNTGITFGFINLKETNKHVLEATKKLNEIFALPVEKRSKHLIHECKDGIVNSSKFFFDTSDGTKITILRSMTKGMKELVKYFSVNFENGDLVENYRIDSSNGKVLKLINNMKYRNGAEILYYSNKQVEEMLLPFLLERYLPEITQNIQEGNNIIQKKEIIEPPKIKTEYQNTNIQSINSNDTILAKKRFMHKVYIPSGYRSVEQLQAGETIKILDNKTEVEEMINIYERFMETCDSMDRFERKRFIDETLNGLSKRRKGLRGMLVENIDKNLSARLLYIPELSLFRILLLDENNDIKKSYLIKNAENLAYSYNVMSPCLWHKIKRFCTERDINIKHPNYNYDMKKVYLKMKEIEKVLDNLY